MEQIATIDAPAPSAPTVADTFLDCLAEAKHETWPFDYWLLKYALPSSEIDALASLPLVPPREAVFNGKRETNNSLRVYCTPENQRKFPVFARLAAGFKDARVRAAIEETTGADLSDGHLRIEYCQDTPGFWLEPHTDISVKKFTMLIYLLDDPALQLAGTDIHEGPPNFEYVCTAPYGRNLGVIFIPGKSTWHAAGHHQFEGVRKSIIVNYVTSAWRDRWELA